MIICEKSSCCGCGLCKSQCPCNAIEMVPDAEGFMYPEINDRKCISCGKCKQVCPILKDSRITENENSNKNVLPEIYSAYKYELQELLKSSAGGVANSISKIIIKDGGVVFGVRYEDDYRGVCFDLAKCEDELYKFSESKYVESDRSCLFEKLPEAIASGKKVLVIGLPCDIAAVRSLVGNPDNLYTCKLICRSNTSKKALTEFIDKCEYDADSKVKKLSLRFKEAGKPTLPTRYRIEFSDGTIRTGDFTKSDYGKAFQILARPSCFHCAAKEKNDLADLTIGDFQGLTADNPLSKINGVSVVCVHTSKGRDLLNATDDLCLEKVDSDVIWKYNWMIYTSIPKSPFRDDFSKLFVEEGLRNTCDQLCKEQNKILDQIKSKYSETGKAVAIWGAGDTTEYLFDRLEMEKWNIVSVFDGSKMKIGKKFRNHVIRDINLVSTVNSETDTLIVMIPSEDETKLNQVLKTAGWNGQIIHVGKYKFYREEK